MPFVNFPLDRLSPRIKNSRKFIIRHALSRALTTLCGLSNSLCSAVDVPPRKRNFAFRFDVSMNDNRKASWTIASRDMCGSKDAPAHLISIAPSQESLDLDFTLSAMSTRFDVVPQFGGF